MLIILIDNQIENIHLILLILFRSKSDNLMNVKGGSVKSLKYLILILCFFLYSACNDLQKISGYVYDYDTGKPVQGAIVKYNNGCEECNEEKDIIGITDSNGRYKINIGKISIFNSDKSIEVKKEGYTTFSDKLNIKKDYELTIYLKESAFKNI